MNRDFTPEALENIIVRYAKLRHIRPEEVPVDRVLGNIWVPADVLDWLMDRVQQSGRIER